MSLHEFRKLQHISVNIFVAFPYNNKKVITTQYWSLNKIIQKAIFAR